MAKKWIQKSKRRMEQKGTVGAFSRKAKAAGMSTKAYASKVMSNKGRYSPATVQQANWARNVGKSKRS